MNNTKRFLGAARTFRSALFFCAAALAPAIALADAWPEWMRLPEQASTYAPQIDDMFHLIMWITGVVFVIVEAMLLIFLWKYRHREGRVATYTHGNNRLEVVWTIIPALICVTLALLSRRMWEDIKEHMPNDAIHVQVTGEQFAWNFRYPGADGKFNTPDDIVTLNQLHFPVGKPVIVELTSKDVIHSFFLPEFRVKQDAVPGMKTHIWFEGTKVGHWEIACAELCGLGHYRMKGFVNVDSAEDYQKWLAEQASAQDAERPKAAAQGGSEQQPAAAAVPEKGGNS